MSGPPFSVEEAEVSRLLGDHYRIDRLAELDVLAENERFRQRGLTRLSEWVYGLGHYASLEAEKALTGAISRRFPRGP